MAQGHGDSGLMALLFFALAGFYCSVIAVPTNILSGNCQLNCSRLVESLNEYLSATAIGQASLNRYHQVQRFMRADAAIGNLFNLGRHLASAGDYRSLRMAAVSEWSRAVALVWLN